MQELEISRLIYANGPGSFMGIKVAYVIFKTISIVKKCEFCAVSGFELNKNQPIRANKMLSFVLLDGKITLKKLPAVSFKLPSNLLNLKLNNDTLPDYVISEI